MNEQASEHIAQAILVLRRKQAAVTNELLKARLATFSEVLQSVIGRIEALEKEAR